LLDRLGPGLGGGGAGLRFPCALAPTPRRNAVVNPRRAQKHYCNPPHHIAPNLSSIALSEIANASVSFSGIQLHVF
jgi:hypothetical protein